MFGKTCHSNIERKFGCQTDQYCPSTFRNILSDHLCCVDHCWGRGELLVATNSLERRRWTHGEELELISPFPAARAAADTAKGQPGHRGKKELPRRLPRKSPVAQVSSWSEPGPADGIPGLWLAAHASLWTVIGRENSVSSVTACAHLTVEVNFQVHNSKYQCCQIFVSLD